MVTNKPKIIKTFQIEVELFDKYLKVLRFLNREFSTDIRLLIMMRIASADTSMRENMLKQIRREMKK